MRSAIRKPCVNSPKYTYTGQEVSPLGVGIAPGGTLDSIYHKGRNGKTWMAVSSHNGDMVWKPVPEDSELKPDDVPPNVKVTENKDKVVEATEEESENEEPVVVKAKVAPKKPAAKKTTKKKEEAVVDEEVEEEVVVEEKKPAKKPTKKKEEVVVEEDVEEDKKPAVKKTTKKKNEEVVYFKEEEKPKRALSDYQKYMSWRMGQIIAEEKKTEVKMKQPDRMKVVAEEWKNIKDKPDEKKEIMEKVNAAK